MTDLSKFQHFQYQLLCKISDFLASWSEPNIQKIAKLLGTLMWIFLYSRRAYTIKAIQLHLAMPLTAAKKLAKQSFQENCLSFFEITRTQKISLDSPNLIVSNPDLLEQIKSSTRPIVACTGHFGSWELLASIIAKLNPDRPAQIVTRKHRNPVIQAYMDRQRSAQGANIIGHRNAVFSVTKALKKHGISAFLVDHKASESEAILLPFFNAPAPVNQGPAILALRSNALVFPVFLTRNNSSYILDILPPLDPTSLTGTREENIKTIALYYTQSVQKIIQTTPSQWLWLHHRWSTTRG